MMFFNTAFSNWEQKCSIKDQESEYLKKYLSTLDKNLQYIFKELNRNRALLESKNKLSDERRIAYDYWVRIYSMAEEFYKNKEENGFYTTKLWKSIILWIEKEFERDFKKLRDYDDAMTELINFVWKYWLETIKIDEKNCPDCFKNTSEKTMNAWPLIFRIYENHKNIKTILREVNQWYNNTSIRTQNLIFIEEPNSFFNNLAEDYSPKAFENCANEYETYASKIKERIQNIFTIENDSKNWIEEWKKSWKLLTESHSDNISWLEKELLKKELKTRWLTLNSQETMLKNLEKYQQEWITSTKDRIINFWWWILNSIWDWTINFAKELDEDLFNNYNKKNVKNVTIKEINIAANNSLQTKESSYKIAELYENTKILMSDSEIDTSQLRKSLLDSHIELATSIELMKTTCSIMVDACNKQWSWKWECWICNNW